jgi:hypothetical protein
MRPVNHHTAFALWWLTSGMSEMPQVVGPRVDGRADTAARQFTGFLDTTLRRLSSLAFGVATVTVLIAAATYATGMLAFDGSARTVWIVVGAVACAVPAVAGVCAWLYVRTTIRHVPRLLNDVVSLLSHSQSAAAMVIDHDSGQPITTTARSLTKLSGTLQDAPGTYPALKSAVRAAIRVPAYLAVAVVTALIIGAFGTLLLLVAAL